MNYGASKEPEKPQAGQEAAPLVRYRALLASVVLAAVGYLGLSVWGGGQSVWAATVRVGVLGLTVALGLSILNYGLRFARWQLYLRAMKQPVPVAVSLIVYLAGFALTTTPGKAGEMLRGVLLKPWGVPYPASFAAFFSERLSDLLAIVMLALLGLAVYPTARPVIMGATALVAIGLLLLTSATFMRSIEARVTGHAKVAVAARHILAMLRQARQCHTPALLGTATTLSLIAWAAEAWAFYLVLSWIGVEVSLTFAVFVYAVSMLAGALSFLPGGLGGAEVVMAGLLVWKGVDHGNAVAATVLIRVTTLWFAVAIGCVALATSTRGRDSRLGRALLD